MSQDCAEPIRKERPANGKATNKGQPTKPLPTRRMAFNKQIELLRAYPAICGSSPRPVSNAEVAPLIDLAPETVSFATSFFVAIGLLERNESGFIPGPELMAFHHAHQWNPGTALHKLAPAFGRAWFCDALLPRIRFRTLTEEEAITVLAEASAAPRDFKSQIRLILDYLEAVGIIIKENGSVKLAPPGNDPQPEFERNGSQTTNGEVAERTTGQVITAFSKAGQGRIQLSIDIDVDMNEMAKWSPALITAFLGGIAQVLTAKGMIEKRETAEVK